VIGSGTMLDTARLRALLGSFFAVDPKNVHAYVLGEHGESEFIPYSQASIGTKAILDVCRDHPDRFPVSYLAQVEQKTVAAAGEIIAAKGATCYGIATALAKLTDAVFSDDRSIFTLSCRLCGEYGIQDVYIGVPAVITRQGIREIIQLSLNDLELQKLKKSAAYLKHVYDRLGLCLV
jgi:L-lactate dehydrogenase